MKKRERHERRQQHAASSSRAHKTRWFVREEANILRVKKYRYDSTAQ